MPKKRRARPGILRYLFSAHSLSGNLVASQMIYIQTDDVGKPIVWNLAECPPIAGKIGKSL